jgi:tetratricopeptide (TPR) repeat protein
MTGSSPIKILPLLLLLALSAFAQTPAANPDQTLARALQLHQSGDFEGAVREYEAFLALRPERADIRSNLGAALARLGRYEQAIPHYRRALRLDSRNAAIRFNLAVALYKNDQVAAAADELAQAVAIQPENRNAALLLADCWLQTGEYKKVVALLEPKAAQYGDDPALAYLLGTALIRDNQPDKGQVFIEKIMRRGDSAEARMMMGTTHLQLADYASAIKEFAEAVKLNPRLPTVHSFYGRALMMTGDTERAREEFLKEVENNPNDFDANLQLGILFKKEQQTDEALKYFRRALQVRAGEPNARFYIASIHVSQGKFAETLPELEKLVADAPDFVEAHVMLATVYYRLRRRSDGDRHQAIVNKLNAERQAKQPGAQEKP